MGRVMRRLTVPVVLAAVALVIPAHPATAAVTGTCTVLVPARVVLRAQGIQSPFDVGARWGSDCPATFIESGYHTWIPEYGDSHPVTWDFRATRLARVPRYWNWGKPITEGRIPLTSFDSANPQVGDVGTGGDFSPRIPGRYRFSPADTNADYVSTNFPGVRLKASNRFVAKYWSALGITAVRSGGTTTITVAARKDVIVKKTSGTLSYAEPQREAPASGARIKLFRDGQLVKTLTLSKDGTAVVRLPSTKSAHTYRALMGTTALNWSATSSVTAN